jgi:hypothetical protein
MRWRTAGSAASDDGHRRIGVDSRVYLSSRLAVLYMTGHWPPAYVDHADGDPSNDRWLNLREATPARNTANMKRHKDNTSGWKGVRSISSDSGPRWLASIGVNRKRLHLGTFLTCEEAQAAYMAKAREVFKEFARSA